MCVCVCVWEWERGCVRVGIYVYSLCVCLYLCMCTCVRFKPPYGSMSIYFDTHMYVNTDTHIYDCISTPESMNTHTRSARLCINTHTARHQHTRMFTPTRTRMYVCWTQTMCTQWCVRIATHLFNAMQVTDAEAEHTALQLCLARSFLLGMLRPSSLSLSAARYSSASSSRYCSGYFHCLWTSSSRSIHSPATVLCCKSPTLPSVIKNAKHRRRNRIIQRRCSQK